MEETQDRDKLGEASLREENTRWTKIRLSLAVSASIIMLVVMGTLFFYCSVKVVNANVGERSAVQTERLQPSPGDRSPYIVEYPHDYIFLVDEPGTCRQQKPFTVLIVPVNPRNRAERDVIRRTWGSQTRSPVSGQTLSLFFLLGLPTGQGAERVQQDVLEESRQHHDLLQANFVDSYANLTVKTMVMFEWLDSRCANASYAMKVDSDTFLNLPNLVDMLLKAPAVNYLTGHVSYGFWPVSRDPKNKNYVPVDVYPESHFPPYAGGPGYALSLDLPRKLVEASRHVDAIYVEDAYVGLCMRYMGVSPTDPPQRSLFDLWVPYSRCAYSKLIVTQWGHNAANRMNNWEDFKGPGPYCIE